MLISALDPTFTLHSDFYYRSLLAKVEEIMCIMLDCFDLPRFTTRGGRR